MPEQSTEILLTLVRWSDYFHHVTVIKVKFRIGAIISTSINSRLLSEIQ